MPLSSSSEEFAVRMHGRRTYCEGRDNHGALFMGHPRRPSCNVDTSTTYIASEDGKRVFAIVQDGKMRAALQVWPERSDEELALNDAVLYVIEDELGDLYVCANVRGVIHAEGYPSVVECTTIEDEPPLDLEPLMLNGEPNHGFRKVAGRRRSLAG
jgi:hypothetical protein